MHKLLHHLQSVQILNSAITFVIFQLIMGHGITFSSHPINYLIVKLLG